MPRAEGGCAIGALGKEERREQKSPEREENRGKTWGDGDLTHG